MCENFSQFSSQREETDQPVQGKQSVAGAKCTGVTHNNLGRELIKRSQHGHYTCNEVYDSRSAQKSIAKPIVLTVAR